MGKKQRGMTASAHTALTRNSRCQANQNKTLAKLAFQKRNYINESALNTVS